MFENRTQSKNSEKANFLIGLKMALLVGLTIISANSYAYQCKQGTIDSLTLEPKAGYMSAEFAGTARFTLKSTEADPGSHLYISEAQQNFDTLYATIMASTAATLNVEVCWLPDSAKRGLYERMTRISIQN
ncbi:MAG: hypothetical protein ACFHVJ_15795 [Aestuariibacter sp.]